MMVYVLGSISARLAAASALEKDRTAMMTCHSPDEANVFAASNPIPAKFSNERCNNQLFILACALHAGAETWCKILSLLHDTNKRRTSSKRMGRHSVGAVAGFTSKLHASLPTTA